jgi:hypothetical protein
VSFVSRLCIYKCVFSHGFPLGCGLRARPFRLPMWGVARVGPNLYRHRDFRFLIYFSKGVIFVQIFSCFFVYRVNILVVLICNCVFTVKYVFIVVRYCVVPQGEQSRIHVFMAFPFGCGNLSIFFLFLMVRCVVNLSKKALIFLFDRCLLINRVLMFAFL